MNKKICYFVFRISSLFEKKIRKRNMMAKINKWGIIFFGKGALIKISIDKSICFKTVKNFFLRIKLFETVQPWFKLINKAWRRTITLVVFHKMFKNKNIFEMRNFRWIRVKRNVKKKGYKVEIKSKKMSKKKFSRNNEKWHI